MTGLRGFGLRARFGALQRALQRSEAYDAVVLLALGASQVARRRFPALGLRLLGVRIYGLGWVPPYTV